MKFKLFIIAIVLLGFQFSAFSQSGDADKSSKQNKKQRDEFKRIGIGVYGETALSWMTPKTSLNGSVTYNGNGTRLVAGWGLLFDYNFTENYTFSTGFRLGGSGGKLSYRDSVGTVESVIYRSYDLRYVDIPLSLKLKTNQIGYMTYFFNIGMRPGFRLSAFVKDKFEKTNLGTRELEYDSNDQTSFIQLGFNIGAGAEFQISKSFSAFAVLSYRDGLIDVLRGQSIIDKSLNENAFVNQVALSVGFMF